MQPPSGRCLQATDWTIKFMCVSALDYSLQFSPNRRWPYVHIYANGYLTIYKTAVRHTQKTTVQVFTAVTTSSLNAKVFVSHWSIWFQRVRPGIRTDQRHLIVPKRIDKIMKVQEHRPDVSFIFIFVSRFYALFVFRSNSFCLIPWFVQYSSNLYN
jgi:hypothetical protein